MGVEETHAEMSVVVLRGWRKKEGSRWEVGYRQAMAQGVYSTYQ